MPRKLPFLHIGGPADGAHVLVEVDKNGAPADIYTLKAMTDSNYGVNPAEGLAADELHAMYQRDERLGDTGFTYVFVYLGTDVLSDRPPMAA